jgi:hypothetical protein
VRRATGCKDVATHHGREALTTTLLLTTGEALEVSGELDDVAKQLENAARSSAGTLAWFELATDGERFGVNPGHVVTVREYPR